MSPSVVSTFGIVFAIGGIGRAAVSVAAGTPGVCARARPEVAAKAPSAKSRRVGRVSIGRGLFASPAAGPLAARAYSSVDSSGACPARRSIWDRLRDRGHRQGGRVGRGRDAGGLRSGEAGGRSEGAERQEQARGAGEHRAWVVCFAGGRAARS